MPALILYLFKVNVALLLFCLGYYLVLRPLTFYTINRVYLIVALIFSSTYPTINFSKVIEQHQQLTRPLQVIIIDFDTRATNFIQPVTDTNYWQWLLAAFWLGVGIMTLRLLMQLVSLWQLYRRSVPATLLQQPVRLITDNANPFSFWQSIYINPDQHSAEELPAIIAHEQVHVNQWHTLDILLAELSLIFYWFNPGVWLIKKAISENLEFITDRKILDQGADSKSYQYSLLYTSFNTSPNAIVNHFNISTIKKRIMMMNAKRSSAFSLTRYSFIVPAVVLMLAFGTSKASFVKSRIKAAKNITHQVINRILPDTIPDSTKHNKGIYKTITDTTVQLKSEHYTPDTLKLKVTTKVSLTSTDTTCFIINGKQATNQQITSINPNDIVSMHIIGPPASKAIFTGAASKGAVLIVTKQGVNNAATQQLLEKLKIVKTNSHSQESGLVSVNPPKGSLNSITIVSTPDSITKKLNGKVSSVTISGSVGSLIKKPNKNAQSAQKASVSGPYKFKTDTSKSPSIRIRYVESVNKTFPLIVVDGKVIDSLELKTLNPNTIESISVLKDKAATVIYGARAIDGVVVISTKKPAKKDE